MRDTGKVCIIVDSVNIEFHYYTVFFLAKSSGCPYEEARTIAYSSQFVDSNIIQYHIDTGDSIYETQITQNYGFWNIDALKTINIPFHFVPGNTTDTAASTRKDGATNPLLVRPDSPWSKALLVDALKTHNPYRIGIGLHSFADTWAHQNFCGLNSPLNVMDPLSVIPAIGHAQAILNPDRLELDWQDPRLRESAISNRERFFSAARKIYRYLRTYNGCGFTDEEQVLDTLAEYCGKPGKEKKMEERILDLVISEDIERYERDLWFRDAIRKFNESFDENLFKGYNKVLWLRDEILYGNELVKRTPRKAAVSFFTSDLYKWMEAAKAHRLKALDLFGHLLKADI